MKIITITVLLAVGFNYQYLFSQNQSENKDNYSNFQNYIDFNMKLVDFENSLYVNDFKTTEFKIENGMIYSINKLIGVSFGINGGVILGIPYEDRLPAYINSSNASAINNFIEYYPEINYLDQTLAKTRFYIGLHPQIGFNIAYKWKLKLGTEIRYFFKPFFEERSYFGNTYREEGVDYILLGNVGLNYILNEHISIGINYDRGISYLRRILIIDSDGNEPYTSSVTYHSLGLNISYSF